MDEMTEMREAILLAYICGLLAYTSSHLPQDKFHSSVIRQGMKAYKDVVGTPDSATSRMALGFVIDLEKALKEHKKGG